MYNNEKFYIRQEASAAWNVVRFLFERKLNKISDAKQNEIRLRFLKTWTEDGVSTPQGWDVDDKEFGVWQIIPISFSERGKEGWVRLVPFDWGESIKFIEEFINIRIQQEVNKYNQN